MLAALRSICRTTPLCASIAGQPFCTAPAVLAAVLRYTSCAGSRFALRQLCWQPFCAATAVLRCTVLQLARCIDRDVHLNDVQHGVILSTRRMRYGAAFRILMQGKLGDTSYMAYAMTRRCSVDGNKSNQNAF